MTSISFFNGASNVSISGGSFSIVSGNVSNYDHSRHTTNTDSFNSKTKTITDSYNNSSQRGYGGSRLTAPNRQIKDRTPSPQYGGPNPQNPYPPQMSPPAQQYPPPWQSPHQGYPPQGYPPQHGYPGSPPGQGQMYNQPQYPYPTYGPPQPNHYGSVPPQNQPNNADENDDDDESGDESEGENPLNQGQQSSSRSPYENRFASAPTVGPLPKSPPKKSKKSKKPALASFSSPSTNSQFQVSDPQVQTMSPELARDFSRTMRRVNQEAEFSDEEDESEEEQITDQMAHMDIDEPASVTPPLSRVKSNPGEQRSGGLSPPSAGPPRPQSAVQFPTGKEPQYPVNTLPHLGPGQYPHNAYQPWAPQPSHPYPTHPGYFAGPPGPSNSYYDQPPPDHVNMHGGSYTTTINSGNHHTNNVIDSYNDNSSIENIMRSGKKKSRRNV